jgi:hypothetical protein
MRIFGRKLGRAGKSLSEAELGRRLTAEGYRCAVRNEVMDAPFAVRLKAPFGWPDPPAPLPDAAFDEAPSSSDVITERYARRGRDLLVRAHLPLPVIGTDAHVFLGIWGHLSIGDFARFRSAQARGDADRLGDLSSWLYSRIPPSTGPVLTKGILVPVAGGNMPVYWITDEKHPLCRAQHDGGITPTEVAELYEEFGLSEFMERLRA